MTAYKHYVVVKETNELTFYMLKTKGLRLQ